MQTPHESRMCPIDFEVKKSKVKVTMEILISWKIVPRGVFVPLGQPRSSSPWIHIAPYHLNPPPPPNIILPPGNRLMIYTIYPCPILFPPPPLDLFCPRIILPSWFIMPHIILPPGNCLMIHTIYPCPTSFPPPPPDSFCPISFCPHIILPPAEKLFSDLHYLPMPRIILHPGLDPLGWAVVL